MTRSVVGDFVHRGDPVLETPMELGLLHRAATAYYVDGLRQEDAARQLGVSRPTVSKLLAEARRIGMVRIEVLDPHETDVRDLEVRLREELGLSRVRIALGDQVQRRYRELGDLLADELRALSLRRGDALLISSGQTTYAVSDDPVLPELPGVLVAPTVGGQQEPEPWFQTNETVRRFSDRTGSVPRFIFAPALPSPELWGSLQADPSFAEITALWRRARAVVAGVGAPYAQRDSITSVVPRDDPALTARGIGDFCLHFYDRDGQPLEFPGSDRLVRPPLETLRRVPNLIAVAAGPDKAVSVRAGVRAGLITTLITDAPTAEAILAGTPTA